MLTKSPQSSLEARQEARSRAERRWRRAQQLPKLCGVFVLATIGFLTILPLLRLQPFTPLIAGCTALICVLAMMATNLFHRSAFMGVQKSRGVSDNVAERAYYMERPFA